MFRVLKELITSKMVLVFIFIQCAFFVVALLTQGWLNYAPVRDVDKNVSGSCRNNDSTRCSGVNETVIEYLQQISRDRQFRGADCAAIISADANAIRYAVNISKFIRGESENDLMTKATRSCQQFQTSRGYVMTSLTSEEEDFPIAYSLIIYTDLEMAERLLRAIYRPQNFYCIHVDIKASNLYFSVISAIAACFPNVFIASQRLNVVWGTFSVLQVELICMHELWPFKTWKYFINLTGQEFPLKTNLELVKILKAFDGANSVYGRIRKSDTSRWKNMAPPDGIKPLRGSLHIVVNRDFVDYALHNQTAQRLLNWTKDTYIPDETFFPVLNFNPQLNISGTYTGSPNDITDLINRYKIWYDKKQCSGHFSHSICILTTGDLPRFVHSKYLFANKFFLREDRAVIGCLEEKLANDTRDEYACAKSFAASAYGQLQFVKKQVRNKP